MERNMVGWFEIYVDDMERAKAFYEEVFGVSLSKLPMPESTEGAEMWQFPATEGETQGPGAAGALVKMEGVSAGGGGTMVYFSSADCAVEASRADAAGGTVVRPKTSLGEYGNMALITDTEGNMVGVHSMG